MVASLSKGIPTHPQQNTHTLEGFTKVQLPRKTKGGGKTMVELNEQTLLLWNLLLITQPEIQSVLELWVIIFSHILFVFYIIDGLNLHLKYFIKMHKWIQIRNGIANKFYCSFYLFNLNSLGQRFDNFLNLFIQNVILISIIL